MTTIEANTSGDLFNQPHLCRLIGDVGPLFESRPAICFVGWRFHAATNGIRLGLNASREKCQRRLGQPSK